MTTKIDFDVAPVDGFERKVVDDLVAKNEGTVDKFDPIGPGGGNPNFVATFSTDDDAERFLNELYGEGQHEGLFVHRVV